MVRRNKLVYSHYLVIFLFVIIIFNIIFLTHSLNKSDKVVDERILNVSFMVDSIWGFDLTPGKLSFGSIPSGLSGVRKVSITNNFDFPIDVNVLASSKISDYLFTDKIENLQPGENSSITLKVIVPIEAQYGNYTGFVKFIFTR